MNTKNYAFWISGLALTGAVMAGNVIDLFFNAYLGRVVTAEEFGIIALINTFMYVGGMFYNALGATAVREVTFLESHKSVESAAAFFSSFTTQVLKVSLIIAVIWSLLVPFTTSFFKIGNPLVFYLFSPLLFFYPLVAVGRGYLQGKLFFALTGFLVLLEPLIKLLSAYLLIELKLEPFVYSSIYISAILTGIIAILMAYFYKPREDKAQKYSFPHKFFWAALLTGVSAISFLALDMVLVKHYLSPIEAGKYAFLSLLGKIIFFLGSLLNIFTITLVAREVTVKKNPFVSFYALFLGSILLCGIGVIALGGFGQFFIPLIFGGKANSIIPYALPYVSAIALFTLGSIIVTYHLARKDYQFPFLSLGLSALLTIGMLIFNNTLTQIVYVLFIVGFINILSLLSLHIYKDHLSPKKIAVKSIEGNIEELF